MKHMKRGVAVVGAAAAAVVFAAAGALVGWGACEAAHEGGQGSGAVAGNELEVAVACDGWAKENAGLGVFVTGARADGAPYDEHLTYDGPGTRSLSVSAGMYQALPQKLLVMLGDGSVVAADGPATCRFPRDEGDGERVELSYAPVDLHGMTDEGLAEIAADSFVDGADAARALELAKGLRDAAPAPDLSTPDIDGEAPGDVPGPLAPIGGE